MDRKPLPRKLRLLWAILAWLMILAAIIWAKVHGLPIPPEGGGWPVQFVLP